MSGHRPDAFIIRNELSAGYSIFSVYESMINPVFNVAGFLTRTLICVHGQLEFESNRV